MFTFFLSLLLGLGGFHPMDVQGGAPTGMSTYDVQGGAPTGAIWHHPVLRPSDVQAGGPTG